MSYRGEPSSRLGCLISLLIFLPVAVFLFFVGLMSGGGCEGREQPCTPDHGPMWIALLLVAVTALAVATLINQAIRFWRMRRQHRDGS
jgi:DMSO/TMAO reductase YedYZ heme-binding membrane subunit